MKVKEVKNLQQLVEAYWRMHLTEGSHQEPPRFLIEVIDYLERKHHLLFNTENLQWHRV